MVIKAIITIALLASNIALAGIWLNPDCELFQVYSKLFKILQSSPAQQVGGESSGNQFNGGDFNYENYQGFGPKQVSNNSYIDDCLLGNKSKFLSIQEAYKLELKALRKLKRRRYISKKEFKVDTKKAASIKKAALEEIILDCQ